MSDNQHPAKGYLAQMDEEQIETVINLPVMHGLRIISESEPHFQEVTMKAFAKAYSDKDIGQLWQNLMNQASPEQALAMVLQKAYVDGATTSYLLDMLSQKSTHEGGKSVSELLETVEKKIAKDNMGTDDDEEREARIAAQYAENKE